MEALRLLVDTRAALPDKEARTPWSGQVEASLEQGNAADAVAALDYLMPQLDPALLLPVTDVTAHAFYHVGRFLQHRRHDVGVGTERQVDLTVPEHILHHARRHTLSEKQCRATVPEVMEPLPADRPRIARPRRPLPGWPISPVSMKSLCE